MSDCFANVTSATITRDIVHTLLRLLCISNRSSFHQCPTECMIRSEKGPDIETVPSASEFLGDTVITWDTDRALLYCIWRRTVASWWLHYGVNGSLWVFIKHQIMSYDLYLLAEILLTLTYDCGSTDQIWTTHLCTWCEWLDLKCR
jgi:hypothetical protein